MSDELKLSSFPMDENPFLGSTESLKKENKVAVKVNGLYPSSYRQLCLLLLFHLLSVLCISLVTTLATTYIMGLTSKGTGDLQGNNGTKGRFDKPTYTEKQYLLTKGNIEGLKGENSLTGQKGIPGDKGSKGINGIKGDKGIQGQKGENGNRGLKGETGIMGSKGQTGQKGSKGEQGEKGHIGDNGLSGIKGEHGEKGRKGYIGEKGPIGKKGPDGDKGEVGDKGLPGDKGESGVKGYMGNKGLMGEKGEKGRNGDNGLPGVKGEHGENGLNGTKGLTGDKGPIGNKGVDGDKGLAGDKGDSGSKGDKGQSGDKGLMGEKGDVGEKGVKGNTGSNGQKGQKGSRAVEKSCGSQWMSFGKYCYYLEKSKKAWHDAQSDCQRRSANLVKIENAIENGLLKSICKESLVGHVWIGANDLNREGRMEWISDKTFVSAGFNDWSPGEPNNSNRQEDCGALWHNSYRWNDVNCRNKYAFICKK